MSDEMKLPLVYENELLVFKGVKHNVFIYRYLRYGNVITEWLVFY